ncbi:hypothetical protein JW968_06575, partial [Candidatus Woesearchaeota archaeon]|nr:hypothetical protein [Candidatus Woesearchaeota archaeon]
MRSDTSKRCISLLMILIFLFANISFVYAQTCMTRNAATGEILSRLRADPLVWGLVLQEYDSDSDGTLNTQELGNLQAAVMGRVDAVIVNRNYEELVEDSGLVGKITSEDADVITRAEVQSIAFSRSPSAPIKLDLGRLENSLLSETEVQSRFGLSPTEIANHDGVKLGGRIG